MQNARVRLRPITLDDAIHYERLLGNDWDSIKTTATIPCPCTEAAAREWLAPRMKMPSYLFAILRQPDDEFVGAIGLVAKLGIGKVKTTLVNAALYAYRQVSFGR